jgi:hypothetical protein
MKRNFVQLVQNKIEPGQMHFVHVQSRFSAQEGDGRGKPEEHRSSRALPTCVRLLQQTRPNLFHLRLQVPLITRQLR